MSLALRFRPFDADEVEAVRRAGEDEELSYARLGGRGWLLDEDVVDLGSGAEVFARAADAVRGWRMFDMRWIFLPDRSPPEPGRTVAFASRHLFVWAVHVSRIVRVHDEPDRYGFAHGTLRSHALTGEERFEVAWDRDTDTVTFGIRSFSALRHPAVRAVRPVARAVQRRFCREAALAVVRAVEGG